ncbi:unnamed protein product [Paramecium pentaurelia]|uniref:Uncharacterized protein n=1 Tax=Paramecium pentaurelia TaxID=43138 RepID=A0A8S1YH21_9CILI|nr:unnamed protein product [Paramecium pentaurelia]
MFFFLFLLRIVLLNAENNFEIIYTAFSEDNFDKEGWHLQNSYSTTLFRKCGNETVFGGFSAFSNTLITYNSSLPPHYQIYASFLFWKIDSWNKEEKECVLIYFDDKLKKECFSVEQDYQLCGTFSEADFDKKVIFDIQMIHSSKNIFIIITSNLNQGAENESWGQKNLKLKY